jgi:hypothetical protein
MDREQIIQWAREAGATFDMNGENHCFETKEELEAFVKLVAAHEREECAKVCDDIDAEYEGEDVLATWCSKAIRARK